MSTESFGTAHFHVAGMYVSKLIQRNSFHTVKMRLMQAEPCMGPARGSLAESGFYYLAAVCESDGL